MSRRLILVTIVILTSFLSACSPLLFRNTGPEEKIVNKDDILAADYMARYLLPQRGRMKLEASLREMALEAEASLKLSTATGIGGLGAMAAGQNPLSQAGLDTAQNIQLGLMAADAALKMIGPDGSLKYVGKVYLPATVDGQSITTPEQAFTTARNFTIKQIENAAEQNDRRAECLLNCEAGSPVFMLVKQGMTGREPYRHMAKVSSETEFYDPPALYVATALGPMVAAEPDVLRDNFLGFRVKWESLHPNSWMIAIGGDVVRTANGDVQSVENRYFGHIYGGVHYSSHQNPLARRVLSSITGDPGYILCGGNGKVLDRYFSMKGKIFGFNGTYFNNFMAYEISPQSYKF